MIEEPDKLTETRGSLEMQNSIVNKFYKFFCPCFSQYKQNKQIDERNNTDYFASNMSNRSTQQNARELELPRKGSIQYSPYGLSYKMPDPFKDSFGDQNNFPSQIVQKKGHKSRSFVVNPTQNRTKIRQTTRQTVDLRQINPLYYTKKKQWFNYPVYKIKEGELCILGRNNKNLLAEVSTVRLQPSPVAVQKQFLAKMDKQQYPSCRSFDQFWNNRYFYFEKFDQGIQIDKESLCNLTPQAVSDYIAGKCSQCKVALDAFSGIGHNATKLGSFCQKVICVQQESKKYNFLINNSKCYQIYNIELFMKPFLDISLKKKVDVVLLHPSILNINYLNSSLCEIKNFKPSLNQIIKKSMKISSNVVLLLPPNVSIKDVCYQISSSSQQITDTIFNSCSVKIEKIFFKSNLSYVAIFFGPNVQHEIKINAQLGFIYKMLKNPRQKSFTHKKLIKYLRQKYGMIKLLNFVSESCAEKYPGMTEIDKFIGYIRNKKLILQHKLQPLLIQEKSTPIKKGFSRDSENDYQSQFNDYSPTNRNYTFEKQTEKNDLQILQIESQQQSGTERTQSFYSSVSGFSAFNKRRTITESKATQKQSKGSDNNFQKQSNNSSIVVKKIIQGQDNSLQKQSKSPASPNIMQNSRRNLLSSHPLQNRKTFHIKQVQKQIMHSSQKSNLKKTLIQK